MAKARTKFVEAPAKSDVYVGMIALTVFAGLIGVAVFALEANEYGWSNQAVSTPAPSLPKMSSEPVEKPDAGGGAARPPAGGGGENANP